MIIEGLLGNALVIVVIPSAILPVDGPFCILQRVSPKMAIPDQESSKSLTDLSHPHLGADFWGKSWNLPLTGSTHLLKSPV